MFTRAYQLGGSIKCLGFASLQISQTGNPSSSKSLKTAAVRTMSRITKRLISTVNFLNNTYASKPIVKAYVTKRLKEECDVKGHDAKGAEYADVP